MSHRSRGAANARTNPRNGSSLRLTAGTDLPPPLGTGQAAHDSVQVPHETALFQLGSDRDQAVRVLATALRPLRLRHRMARDHSSIPAPHLRIRLLRAVPLFSRP